eukprot:gene34170-42132_t
MPGGGRPVRGVWLAAQLAIAATFVLALAPRAAEWSVLPAIELVRSAPSKPGPASPAQGAPAPQDGWAALDGAAGDADMDATQAMPRDTKTAENIEVRMPRQCTTAK